MFMSQGRGTPTDQLTNVIQVIQMGRKSGLLIVERGDGPTLEKGEITFVHGQITQARGGQLSGQQALDWLNTWGACRFSFTASPAGDTIHPQTDFRQTPIAQSLKDTNPYLRTPPITKTDSLLRQSRDNNAATSKPRRLRSNDEALRLLGKAGLSRTHRHLFLLIDGKRTVSELVRLMGRKYDDVHRLLQELEHIGVIQQ